MPYTSWRVGRLTRHTDNLVGFAGGVALEGDVRVAIPPRFTSLADPPTRLFWD
jgi:hypothetical protein